MSPIIHKDKITGEVDYLSMVRRAYRNGKRVYHYSPYVPYTPMGVAAGFTVQNGIDIVRLMNPVEDVSIS